MKPSSSPKPLTGRKVLFMLVAFFGVVIACVNASGSVESARVVHSAHRLLDPELLSKVRTWKFFPYQVGGHPTPFCFMWRCTMRAL